MKKTVIKWNKAKRTTGAKLRTVVVVLCALLAVFVVLDVSLSWGVTKACGNWVGRAFSGVGSFFLNIKQDVDDWFDEIAHRKQVYVENQALQEEIDRLESEKNRLEEYRLENERLRALMELPDSLECRAVAYAGVSSISAGSLHNTITINAGADQGVASGMAVATERGLVGVVEEVFDSHSTVTLLMDIDSSVSAILQNSRTAGVLTGNSNLYFSNEKLQMTYMSASSVIQEGDAVITSGYDEFIPKGICIGTVESVSFNRSGNYYTAVVTPQVDFLSVETVAVLAKPE